MLRHLVNQHSDENGYEEGNDDYEDGVEDNEEVKNQDYKEGEMLRHLVNQH